MNDRIYFIIIMGLSLALTWFCFNKIEMYICETKSKKLKILYFCFAITSVIASIIISSYPYDDEFYITYILKGYVFGVSSSLWSFESIKEKSERRK